MQGLVYFAALDVYVAGAHVIDDTGTNPVLRYAGAPAAGHTITAAAKTSYEAQVHQIARGDFVVVVG